MIQKKIKPYQLFEDLAEKQRVIKANSKKVTLEEARALTQWIKEGKADRKERNDLPKMEEQIK